jgi:HlyD family secretion protein
VRNDDLKLRPGMTANVSIITAQRTNVVRIPNAALRYRPPESALVSAGTNGVAGAGAGGASTNQTALGPSGMPTPPWFAEGRAPSREEREKWMQSLTPEQRDQMRQMRERMRGQFGEGGFGGGFRGGGAGGFGMMGGGAGRSPGSDAPETRSVYLLVRTNTPSGREVQMARAVTVKTGITDGAFTEVLAGLSDGDTLITGANTPQLAAAGGQVPQGTSPFAPRPPFGGPPRR